MIFKETWQQVLDGTKTQTRRPTKPTQWAEGIPGYPPEQDGAITAVYDTNGHLRLRWLVGNTYAVQPGRGKKAVGRIRITKIRRERLQEITYKDCYDEGMGVSMRAFMWGVDDRKKFARLWDKLYRKPYRWEDNPEVWVLEFEPV